MAGPLVDTHARTSASPLSTQKKKMKEKNCDKNQLLLIYWQKFSSFSSYRTALEEIGMMLFLLSVTHLTIFSLLTGRSMKYHFIIRLHNLNCCCLATFTLKSPWTKQQHFAEYNILCWFLLLFSWKRLFFLLCQKFHFVPSTKQ